MLWPWEGFRSNQLQCKADRAPRTQIFGTYNPSSNCLLALKFGMTIFKGQPIHYFMAGSSDPKHTLSNVQTIASTATKMTVTYQYCRSSTGTSNTKNERKKKVGLPGPSNKFQRSTSPPHIGVGSPKPPKLFNTAILACQPFSRQSVMARCMTSAPHLMWGSLVQLSGICPFMRVSDFGRYQYWPMDEQMLSQSGAFLAAAVWGGQICIWGPIIPKDIIHDDWMVWFDTSNHYVMSRCKYKYYVTLLSCKQFNLGGTVLTGGHGHSLEPPLVIVKTNITDVRQRSLSLLACWQIRAVNHI